MTANAPANTTEIVVDLWLYRLSDDARRDVHQQLMTCVESQPRVLGISREHHRQYAFALTRKDVRKVVKCVENLESRHPRILSRVVAVNVIRGFYGQRPCKRPSSA